MANARALIALGVTASLVIVALAVPGRSSAAPTQSQDAGLPNQGWSRIDPNVEMITQDKDSVLIYSPYRGTLKVISKYQDIPIRVVNVNKVPKPASE